MVTLKLKPAAPNTKFVIDELRKCLDIEGNDFPSEIPAVLAVTCDPTAVKTFGPIGAAHQTPVNQSINVTVDATLYTVTAGKTLYIKNIQFNVGATATAVGVRDGGGAGTRKWTTGAAGVNANYSLNFDSPLTFKTNVAITDTSVGINFWFNFTGWEE